MSHRQSATSLVHHACIAILSAALTFSAGCQAPDENVAAAGSEENLTTKDPTGAIRDFEALGGSGTWFESVMPDRLGGKPGSFYLVKTVPPRSSPTAKLFMLRTEQTRQALADVVAGERAPVVIGEIPEETQVFAAALMGYDLAKDALKAGDVTDKKAVILLRENSDVFTLAHENRHWVDYETPSFVESLDAEFGGFVAKHGLDAQFGPALKQITLEIRGHVVQARQARKAAKEGWPYINRAGAVVTEPKEQLEASYRIEQAIARQIFQQAYSPAMNAITSPMTETQRSELGKLLQKYDSSDDPENKITFKNTFGL